MGSLPKCWSLPGFKVICANISVLLVEYVSPLKIVLLEAFSVIRIVLN
jgi:hypothetical protein